MPYPEQLVAPMRTELVQLGVNELSNADEVRSFFSERTSDETTVLIINSVCGCAAANARPAINLAQQAANQPDHYVTVFAGQDLDATAAAREYLVGIPPSSPFIALMKGRDPIFVLERRHIEGRTAAAIASDLVGAFEADLAGSTPPEPSVNNDLPGTFKSIL